MENNLPKDFVEYLFDATPCALFISCPKGDILKWNTSMEKLTGWTKSQAQGERTAKLLGIDLPKGNLAKEQKVYTQDNHIRSKHGGQIDAQLKILPLTINGEDYLLVQTENLDDQRHQERKVISSVLETEERERQNFAKRLHDDIGPLLSSLKMFMKVISQAEDEKKRDALIDNVYNVLNDAIVKVKDISNQLNPHLLVNFGLESAMRTYLDKLHTEKAIFELKSNLGDARFDPNIERIIFKTTKELVRASAKDPENPKILITYHYTKEMLQMRYQDQTLESDKVIKASDEDEKQGLQYILNQLKQLGGQYHLSKDGTDGFDIQIKIGCKIKEEKKG